MTLAQALGLNKAIILNQLHYWLIKNKNKERNFRDGHYWTYNSIEKWQEQFPFWNSRTIERTLWKLEADGIVKTSKHNKLNLDRTKWYRIDYARLIEVLLIGHNGLFDSDKLSQWLGQYVTMDKATESDNMSPPIPETNIHRLLRLILKLGGYLNTSSCPVCGFDGRENDINDRSLSQGKHLRNTSTSNRSLS